MLLENKTAVVTGGTRGIGYAIAEALLQNGANVLKYRGRSRADVQAAAEKLAPLGKIEAASCDVRNEDHVRMLFEHCTASFGGVDIVVNNAGIGIMGKTVEEMSGAESGKRSRPIYSAFFTPVTTQYRI